MYYNFLNQYITGDRFKMCARTIFDFIINDKMINTLKHVDRVWCKTDYVHRVFEKCRDREKPMVLITHNSDINITEELLEKKPSCITHWYAQNAIVEDPTITPIPIGTENTRSPRGYSGDMGVIEQLRRSKLKKGLWCFMNFNIKTNQKERQACWDRFKDESYITKHEYGMEFKNCMRAIRMSRFTICPEGHGHDTHRVWESLYLDTVPIVKRSTFYESFKELPILMVDDWEEVTKDLLESFWNPDLFNSADLSKMLLNHWRTEIRRCLI